MRSERTGKRWCRTYVRMDGSSGEKEGLKLFFIDTVLEISTTEDTLRTANILYSICVRLKKEVPHRRSYYLFGQRSLLC